MRAKLICSCQTSSLLINVPAQAASVNVTKEAQSSREAFSVPEFEGALHEAGLKALQNISHKCSLLLPTPLL